MKTSRIVAAMVGVVAFFFLMGEAFDWIDCRDFARRQALEYDWRPISGCFVREGEAWRSAADLDS
jgi:hypothetical protein